MRALEQVFGAVVMLAVLLDVFLTVLYARVGTGILSPKLARLTWRLFRLLPTGRYQSMVLSFCGPTILVLLVLTWSVLLAFGAGLIIHPVSVSLSRPCGDHGVWWMSCGCPTT